MRGVRTWGLETGKIKGGRAREVGAGKSGRRRIVKGGKWGENAQQCLIFRNRKGLKGESQEKWGGSRENKAREVLPPFPFPHGSLRVLSKSLLVHSQAWKKSLQDCLICGKNGKFNFGKLRPAVVWEISLKCQPSPPHITRAIFGFYLEFIWETLWPPKIKALPSRSTSKYCAVHIYYPAPSVNFPGF